MVFKARQGGTGRVRGLRAGAQTGSGVSSVTPAYSTVLTGYASLQSYWPHNDVNVSSLPNLVDTKAARNMTANTGQGGLLPERPTLIGGQTIKELSYLYSRGSNAIFYSAFTGAPFDKTGADTVSISNFVCPGITRSGSARYYWFFTKTTTAFNAALSTGVGYLWGMYWDGTSTLKLCLHQRVSGTDYLEIMGSTNLLNDTSYHVAVTRGTGKNQAAVALYVNGVAETTALGSGSPSTLTGSTTNASAITIGGRGGGGGADVLDGYMSHLCFFSTQLSQAEITGLALPAIRDFPPPITSGATNTPVLVIDDNDSDIDGVNAIGALIGAQLRGEITVAGYCTTTSNNYSIAAAEAMFLQHGITVPFYGAYKANDKVTTSAWAQTVATTWSGKTRANYDDATTAGRKTLAANTGIRILNTGPLHVLQAIMQSAADGISASTGMQLVTNKAVAIYMMGGHTASASAEYNFAQSPAAAAYVFANNPIPIYNVSFELQAGINVAYGGNAGLDPIRQAVELYGGTDGFRKTSFDDITAYIACRPATSFVSLQTANGTNTVNSSTGVNTWSATTGTHNLYQIGAPGANPFMIAIESLTNDGNGARAAGTPTPSFQTDFTAISSLPTGVSLTRSTTGTRFNSSGTLVTEAIDAPRFDYTWNGSAWVSAGLLIEEQRTNLFLQTGSPANQTITVANGTAYSVSFYGTGTLTLTGAATQTMNGSSANVRTSYTFTASTTSLVIAVSGTVTYPNVEAGGFATSHIITTSAVVTRSPDVVKLVGSAFTALTTLPYSVVMKMVDTKVDFFNAILAMGGSGGTNQTELLANWAASTNQIMSQDNSTANNNLVATLGSDATTGPLQLALGVSSGGRSLAANGGTVVTDANIPTVGGTDIFLAQSTGAANFTTMHCAGIAIYSSRLSDADLQTKSVVGAAF